MPLFYSKESSSITYINHCMFLYSSNSLSLAYLPIQYKTIRDRGGSCSSPSTSRGRQTAYIAVCVVVETPSAYSHAQGCLQRTLHGKGDTNTAYEGRCLVEQLILQETNIFKHQGAASIVTDLVSLWNGFTFSATCWNLLKVTALPLKSFAKN